MMAHVPRLGCAVAVLEFGSWLEGVVAEVNEASDEFLVDFDDEGEVPAWVSASQPWRDLSPAVNTTVLSTVADEEPALPDEPPPPPLPVLTMEDHRQAAAAPATAAPAEPPADPAADSSADPLADPPADPPADSSSPLPSAPLAAEPTPQAAAEPVDADMDDAGMEHLLVFEEFSRLHEATVLSDGHGAEPAYTTQTRFERLLQRTPEYALTVV